MGQRAQKHVIGQLRSVRTLKWLPRSGHSTATALYAAMTVTSDTKRAREVVKRFYDGGARGEIATAGCRAPCTLHTSTPALPPGGLAIRRFHLRVE
jgi:hypothetical protein